MLPFQLSIISLSDCLMVSVQDMSSKMAVCFSTSGFHMFLMVTFAIEATVKADMFEPVSSQWRGARFLYHKELEIQLSCPLYYSTAMSR